MLPGQINDSNRRSFNLAVVFIIFIKNEKK